MAPEAADNLVSRCLMFLFIVSLSKRNNPRYSTQSACFILLSFICGKIFSLLVVKLLYQNQAALRLKKICAFGPLRTK